MPIFQVLKAFRADNVPMFKAGLAKMDKAYCNEHQGPQGRPSLRWSLCRELATLAISEKKVGILEPILESNHEQCGWQFDRQYDLLKEHPEGNEELLRVIDKSGYKKVRVESNIPDYHPWL
jgi:hypothetical protein